MSGKYDSWDVCVTPPITNGSSTTPKLPTGCRAVALTTTPSETVLDLDVFRAPPDGAGNAATANFEDRVLLRVFADGQKIDLLFGAKGAGLTPDPTATGTSANVSEAIPDGTYVDYWVNPRSELSIYARTRTGAGTMRYRLSGPLPGNR